jgi:probable rRNA maturation factor
MSIRIQISRSLHLSAERARSLRHLLKHSARVALENVCPQFEAELSLVLSDDAQLQELNCSYRGIDAVTDVLSFPGGEIDPESGKTYLGDVLISYPQAISQAASGKHTVEAELQLLAVHGALHLCGYDHVKPEDKSTMWERQAEVLKMLDSPISGPAEELQ